MQLWNHWIIRNEWIGFLILCAFHLKNRCIFLSKPKWSFNCIVNSFNWHSFESNCHFMKNLTSVLKFKSTPTIAAQNFVNEQRTVAYIHRNTPRDNTKIITSCTQCTPVYMMWFCTHSECRQHRMHIMQYLHCTFTRCIMCANASAENIHHSITSAQAIYNIYVHTHTPYICW